MMQFETFDPVPTEEKCLSAGENPVEERKQAIRYSEKLACLFDFLPDIHFDIAKNFWGYSSSFEKVYYYSVNVHFRDEHVEQGMFVEHNLPKTWKECDSEDHKQYLQEKWNRMQNRENYGFYDLSREEAYHLRMALFENGFDAAEYVDSFDGSYLKLYDDVKLKKYIWQFYLNYRNNIAFMAEDDPNTVWLYWTDEMDQQIDENGFHFLYMCTPLISEDKPVAHNEHIIMKAHKVDFVDVYFPTYIVKSERI